MKYLFIFIISVGFLTSCNMEKYCSRNYPPQVEIHDSIIYRTKVITMYDTIYIKADTIKNIDTVIIDKNSGLINSRKVYATSEFAYSWAQVKSSKLNLVLIQNDTAIANKIEANVKYKEVYKTKIVKVKVWEVHWYDKVARFIAFLFILALLILIVIKVIKAYITI